MPIVLGLMWLALWTALPVWAQALPVTEGVVAFPGGLKINVELADTDWLREKGLMHRPVLAQDRGMLFVFQEQAERSVWMKNTLLPLDVLFLSEDGAVVGLLADLSPCRQAACPIYDSGAPARYMLEVNAGFIAKHGIGLGQVLTLDYRH